MFQLKSAPLFGAPLRAKRYRLSVNIGVNQSANHALVLRVMFRRPGLKKLDAFLAESERDFHALFTKR